ncbi:hypothetical protein, partial [Methylocapsa palsarum]|uniref:hypothetical protein n=1 Tax=Methylocapsa palsarum TaxID=1612308 RepID=UPI001587E14F
MTCTALLGAMLAQAAMASPVIFNQPFSALPGDFVSLTGTGFGPAPRVFLKTSTQAAIEIKGVNGKDKTIDFQLPKTTPFAQYEIWVSSDQTSSSPHVYINAPRAMHFDFPQVASSGPLRIFARNLSLGLGTPTVSFVDPQTKASLSAKVNVSGSSAYCLSISAPAGLVAGKSYNVVVSNGFGSAVAEQTITARAGGADPFGLGAPWAADFAPLSANKYDVKTSTALTLRAKG